jgi:hypothetical protein
MDRGFRTLDDLRAIVERVELKAHVRADDPDLLALRGIIEQKIARLEHEIEESRAKKSGEAT